MTDEKLREFINYLSNEIMHISILVYLAENIVYIYDDANKQYHIIKVLPSGRIYMWSSKTADKTISRKPDIWNSIEEYKQQFTELNDVFSQDF